MRSNRLAGHLQTVIGSPSPEPFHSLLYRLYFSLQSLFGFSYHFVFVLFINSLESNYNEVFQPYAANFGILEENYPA